MLRKLTIRPFRPGDQPAARALILAGLAEHWGTLDPTLNRDLDDIGRSYGNGRFLVALQGETLVGTGALIPEAPGVGRILRMSVARSHRRQGIGRAVLDGLISEARSLGYGQIVLETTAMWHDAVAFYGRAGFTTTGVREDDRHFHMDIL